VWLLRAARAGKRIEYSGYYHCIKVGLVPCLHYLSVFFFLIYVSFNLYWFVQVSALSPCFPFVLRGCYKKFMNMSWVFLPPYLKFVLEDSFLLIQRFYGNLEKPITTFFLTKSDCISETIYISTKNFISLKTSSLSVRPSQHFEIRLWASAVLDNFS